jgi:branched-chain amino acid transport system ATP-binding protein
MTATHENRERPLLELQGVSKFFGGLVALDGVDIKVWTGEIVGLIGPNGAGKTTLFNVISGSHHPERGKVFFQATDITGLKPHRTCYQGIARTFQIPKPFLRLTVLENMMVGAYFGSRLGKRKETFEKVIEILHWAGLEKKTFMPAESLNLIERKKLEVARALSTLPKLVLLDEVIAGLNPTESSEMISFITKLRTSGLTIFMIEHLMKVIMNLSDRIVVLHYGKKLCEGPPQEVASNPEVIEAYLGVKTDA